MNQASQAVVDGLFVLYIIFLVVPQVCCGYDDTTIRVVDSEVCERRGLMCGSDNRALKATRCCESVHQYGFSETVKYSCCNPQLTGLIIGVTVGTIAILCCGVIIGCFILNYWRRRKRKRKQSTSNRKISSTVTVHAVHDVNPDSTSHPSTVLYTNPHAPTDYNPYDEPPPYSSVVVGSGNGFCTTDSGGDTEMKNLKRDITPT